MSDTPLNVLFLCTGNSARSIIAEALMRDLGKGRFNAFSAGTEPTGKVNGFALALLERNGHDIGALRSKDLAEFQTPDAPVMDFVFTVCDHARETCPVWPGHPVTAHWGLPDPAAVEGSEAERAYAFAETYGAMHRRISAFVSLPLAALDRVMIQRSVDEIGEDDRGPA